MQQNERVHYDLLRSIVLDTPLWRTRWQVRRRLRVRGGEFRAMFQAVRHMRAEQHGLSSAV